MNIAEDAPPASGDRAVGPALESHYRFLLWLVPAVDRLPRKQKFLPGDRIQTTALDVLEALIEATYTRRRAGHLTRANMGVEKLRFLFRLAHDLRHLDRRCYEHAPRAVRSAPSPRRSCSPPLSVRRSPVGGRMPARR